jgi:ABC-type spermidine/putrescine transport system permease subunit II
MRRLMREKSPFLAAWFVFVVIFLYTPLAFVIGNGFNADASLITWGGFTTQWFNDAWHDPQVRSALRISLIIATEVSLLSVLIALGAALWARNASKRFRTVLDATTYTRLVLPEVMAAIGLFILFRRYGIALGSTAIVAGHVVYNSAWATVVIQARMAGMGHTLEEAAADLGASSWRTFRLVTLPQLRPALFVSFLLVFSFSLDDVVTSLFLGGPNTQTLPVLLLGLVRHQVTPEVNAIGAIVLFMTTTTFLAAVAIAGLSTTLPRIGRSRGKGEVGVG